MGRFIAALCVGFLAWSFARGIGIPAWRQWMPGDAADIAICAYLATWFLTPAKPNSRGDEG